MRFFLLFVIILFFSYPSVAARPMIIDTDVGTDDVIALFYLLKHPNLDIKAITIDGNGNAHCYNALNNTRGLLKIVNKLSIPVACGAVKSLQGWHHYPDSVLQEGDTLANTPLAIPHSPFPKQTAINLISSTLKNSKKPIDIVAIGTMTTIASVLLKYPFLKHKIHHLYFMGGAINVKGNIQDVIPTSKNQFAEWNVYIDPIAVKLVFNSGIPITLIPLDVTSKVPVDLTFYHLVKSHLNNPAMKFIFNMLNRNKNLLIPQNGKYWWYLWDPVAGVVATDASICRLRKLPLNVTLTPEIDSGRIYIDSKSTNFIEVCTELDVPRFENKLINELTR